MFSVKSYQRHNKKSGKVSNVSGYLRQPDAMSDKDLLTEMGQLLFNPLKGVRLRAIKREIASRQKAGKWKGPKDVQAYHEHKVKQDFTDSMRILQRRAYGLSRTEE